MLLWLRDCPTLDLKDGDAAAAADAERRFLDSKDKVTSWNHAVDVPPAQGTNPLIRHGDFTLRNLSAILNRVQVHMCTDGYCLRTVNARPEHGYCATAMWKRSCFTSPRMHTSKLKRP
ncbi:hypothetical protein E4U09_000660 [Claviceps aff. purpurea]|uniref:Uncharacterized protein n=1 Tax=Claviceps aff. purpurea TaxID=1967640 RepID=A0A9P7Q8P0_9HYPO|nr:hypothetical protein E4U09_000660 [Claviceps aff. purpurea]